MALKTFLKDPDETQSFTIEYDFADGDTISSSSWTVDTGITKDSDTNNTTEATVWLSGGTAGTTFECTNTVVTTNGRTLNRTIAVAVSER